MLCNRFLGSTHAINFRFVHRKHPQNILDVLQYTLLCTRFQVQNNFTFKITTLLGITNNNKQINIGEKPVERMNHP